MKLKIEYDKCKSCGLCVDICPKKILYIDRNRLNKKGYNPVNVKDANECIGCGSCYKVCPDIVFEVGDGA